MSDYQPFYCIRVRDLTPDKNILCTALEEAMWPSSMYQDEETREAFQTLYYTTAEERDAVRDEFREFLDSLAACGVSYDSYEVFDLPPENWAESWKRFFHIQHLSPTLVIRPKWLDYTPEEGQTVIDIDPGMSFGTGRHATTMYCLEQLEILSRSEPLNQGVLDAGCGSGILSIAAAKMGFSPIEAFDYDPQCMPCSRENAELNGLAPEAIDFYQADLTRFEPPRTYRIVMANILAPLLISEHQRLIKALAADGTLILAGILTTEYGHVRETFEKAGLKEVFSATLAEWTGGTFKHA